MNKKYFYLTQESLQFFTPAKNLIRPADSRSSWSNTDKEINPSPEGG